MKNSKDVFGVQNASFSMLWELFTQFSKPCFCLFGSRESTPVDEEERTRKKERKMGASASVSLALEGIDLFVDWWEEQHCL